MEMFEITSHRRFWLYAVGLIVSLWRLPDNGRSLPSPVQCDSSGCTLTNYQGEWIDRTPCRAARVLYPTSEEEMVAAVAEAVRTNTKVKVVTEISHSLSKVACPGGNRGLMISTRDYKLGGVLTVDREKLTATAPAGLQLRDFVRLLAEKHGLALPFTPLWDGVSVGGVIATGSHGSGLYLNGSSVSEYVVAVRIVVPAPPSDGYAAAIDVSDPAVLNAVKLSLGVLGAVSRVTFSVMPMFKRSLSLEVADDSDLGERLLRFARAHHFASLFWVPSASKVIYKKEDLVPVETDGEGVNVFPLVQPMLISQIEAMRAHQEHIEDTGDVARLCEAGEKMVEHRLQTGDGYLSSPGGHFEGYPIVGYNHRMQTVGGCQVADEDRLPAALARPATSFNAGLAAAAVGGENLSDWRTCKWDPRVARRVFYHHTAVAVALERAAELVEDVKRLREADPEGMCGMNMFGGVHLRFVRKGRAYLGDREDAAVFELVYFRARDGRTPRLHQDVLEEIEQMLVFKYGGRPHYGKNREVAFVGAAKKVLDLPSFLDVKRRLDPQGLFSSDWSDYILGLRPHPSAPPATLDDADYCALEGLCVCREHRHCNPAAGYTCQAGRVFADARVCRYQHLADM